MNPPDLTDSIASCIANGERLVEDAELLHSFCRFPTALSISVLAQEEFAKAFLLVLVRREVIPWTIECQKALRSHDCKHLAGVMIEWLGPPLDEALARSSTSSRGKQFESFPPNIAVAINILRHEKFERFRSGYADRDPEDNGPSRKIAEGLLDRVKQRGFYVGITKQGQVDSLPNHVTEVQSHEQFERAKLYRQFASDASSNCILSFVEYELFCETVTAVFANLGNQPAT